MSIPQNTIDQAMHTSNVGLILALFITTTIGTAIAEPSPYHEVDVFTIGEAGYFCIKIPYIFTTFNGTMLALGEGRKTSCSDFAPTDLVFKVSEDAGASWGPLRVLHTNGSNTVGNAAPLQLRDNGRILIPFCINNFYVYQIFSDDNGHTWSVPEFIPSATQPDWQWVGTGPPGGLQLASGRLIVPSYHSYVADTDGDITRIHMMINDDPSGNASSWFVGGAAPGIEWTNECQAVELAPNHLLITTHGFVLPQRMQVESFDGGLTLGEPYFVDIGAPFGGCEGSIVKLNSSLLVFSGTVNPNPERNNMTIWTSHSEGKVWDFGFTVNAGRTAYSSLAVMPDGASVGLLYERSNVTDFIFIPTHFSFLVVYPFPVAQQRS
jgi:sialidase-1